MIVQALFYVILQKTYRMGSCSRYMKGPSHLLGSNVGYIRSVKPSES